MYRISENNLIIKRIILYLMIITIVICGSIPAFAGTQDGERQTIKAGFFAWDGYHVEDKNGLRSGYGYDFLKITENYCNWKVDFIGYDKTWSDMLDMLDNGDVDLLTSAQKTAEWEAKYDFSDQPIGNSATVLSVRSEEKKYVVGDASTYNGMTVGCLKGSSRNDKFSKYAKENNFTFEFVEYNDLSELKKALADKKVDGILSTNLRTFNGETVLEEFDPTDYYVIVKKGNKKILDQINSAIEKMNFNTPSWKEELQNEYFMSKDEEDMIFNADELEYLKMLKNQDRVFTIATNPDLAPYSSYDKDGNPVGIAPELFCEIADRIGLKYKFESFDTYSEYNTFVREGKADIDLTCFHDFGLGAQHGIIITNPYMTTSLAMVSQSSFNGEVNKLAVVEGSNYNTTYSEGLFGKFETVNFPSNKEVIKAVLDGKVDAAYQYTYTAQKEVENDVKNGLTYTILPQYQIEMCMGTNEKQDYRLVSILNEGIRALSGTYTEHIIQEKITDGSEKPGLMSFIYDYPALVNSMVVIFIVIIVIIVYVIAKKKQTETKLVRESEINNARTEFFLMISHEIRTPLNAVVSYLRMLREEFIMEDDAKGYLDKAQSAAKQLTEISDNMRDYSQISLGTIELNDGVIKLKEVILQINQIVALKAKEKKQNYSFDISNLTRQYLAGDSLRITLIFQNILENAVKFTQEGGKIEAALTEEYIDNENVNILFTCKDTGKGMSEEFTKKINTAFHQSDSSYSRTHGGLGLGLFLTQFFVKMMNGTFEVESKEGEGSSFTIVLPMKSPKIEELQSNGIKCRPIRAIIYETGEQDIKMAKETLKSIGVKVDIVNDLGSLSKRIRSRFGGPYQYSLCIINVDLLKDYADVIHELSQNELTPPIIAITGDEGQVESIRKHNEISHVVFKKYSYFELFNAIITDFGENQEEADLYSKYDYTGIHALIAEDNPVNADILSKMLKKEGIESTICENGKIAVDTFNKAKEYSYQIIFMDIQMPEMDGIEAARKIRESDKTQGADIPIVAVSANAFPEDVKKSLDAGMNNHVAKPVDRKHLFEEIEKYCSKYIIEKKTIDKKVEE